MFRLEKAIHVAREEGLQLILAALMGLRPKPDFVDCEQGYPISRPHVLWLITRTCCDKRLRGKF
jgi:hypothetical protein